MKRLCRECTNSIKEKYAVTIRRVSCGRRSTGKQNRIPGNKIY
jgi:hypothetical protein